MAETNSAPVSTPKFTVEQLANSRKYAEKRDVLHAVLDHKKQYSHDEVDKAITDFDKRDLTEKKKGVKK